MSNSRKSSDKKRTTFAHIIIFSLKAPVKPQEHLRTVQSFILLGAMKCQFSSYSADGSRFSSSALFPGVLWSSGTPREAVLYLLAPPLTWITTAAQAQGALSGGLLVDAGAEPERTLAR